MIRTKKAAASNEIINLFIIYAWKSVESEKIAHSNENYNKLRDQGDSRKNRILFKSNFVRSISSYHFFFFFGFLLLYMMNGFCDGVVCPLVAVCKKCFWNSKNEKWTKWSSLWNAWKRRSEAKQATKDRPI